MMMVVTTVSLGILTLAAMLALTRLVRKGISLADRVVALDLLLLIIVMGIAVGAIRSRTDVFVDVLVVVALLAFVGTVTVARFIERRGL
jgi:multicomponent Na+:H+ antiporter subunit F